MHDATAWSQLQFMTAPQSTQTATHGRFRFCSLVPALQQLFNSKAQLRVEWITSCATVLVRERWTVKKKIGQNIALKEAQCDGITFWTKMVTAANYPLLHKMAINVLTMFGSTYRCESAFSTMNIVKNKYRTRLTNEHLYQCLRLAITPFVPKFKVLATSTKCNFSH